MTASPPGVDGNASYPAAPTAQAPVPPPPGAGLDVPVQPYFVVDQFGYLPEMQKVAVIADPQAGWNAHDDPPVPQTLEVRRWADATVALSNRVTAWRGGQLDAASGDKGYWFDFSQLKAPGTYYLYDPQAQVRSHPFRIAADVYRGPLRAAQRAFYFSRANAAKASPYACDQQRCWEVGASFVGPQQDGQARSSTEPADRTTARELTGGWFDGGLTTKSVTTAYEAVHGLLTAFYEKPEAFSDTLRIPESGNGIPDILDEAKLELDWIAKMQAKDLGGGVLLKVGPMQDDPARPDQSQAPRFYTAAPCSAATIAAASLFAHGSLLLGRFERFKTYSQDLQQRAQRAWSHYQASPKSDRCDDGSILGENADWPLEEQTRAATTAAVYLWALTKNAEFLEFISDHYQRSRPFTSDTWSVRDPSEGDALLFYASQPEGDASVRRAILGRKQAQADRLDLYRFRPNFDLYRAFIRPSDYVWGSNGLRAGYANTNYDMLQHGLVANVLTKQSYLERAASLLHALHGVNAMQLTYLTNMYGYGASVSADELYHPWFRDGDPAWDNARTSQYGPAPGFLTGGPNSDYCKDQSDDHACARSPVRMQPPAKAYLDSNLGWAPDNKFDKTWQVSEPNLAHQAAYVRLVSKFAAE